MTVQSELLMRRPPEAGLDLILSVLLTREVLAGVLDSQLFGPFEVTDQQFNVLRILRGGPEEGYTVAELRRRLLHRSADAVRLVDRLVRQGLVERGEHPGDRRASLVRLTAAGRSLHEHLEAPHQAICARIGELLPAQDRIRLVALLEQLRTGLRRFPGT